MERYSCSGARAWHRLNDNPAGRWSNGLQADPEPGTAWQRISSQPFFDPMVRPGFAISREDRVFAIGSCFARHVEAAFASLGFRVDSMTSEFDGLPTLYPRNGPLGFTNKFNPCSILNELRWALDPSHDFPVEALVELEDGWEDPHASPVFAPARFDVTLRRHRTMIDLTKRIDGCRIVVVTLGLIEVFLDTATGLYTNSTPDITAGKGRYKFRVLTFDQVMAALREIHSLLSEHGHPDVQVVVTVSPVPIRATFTGEDVVVANTMGKSLLRAAAGQWAAEHDNVRYFPGYEIVLNSERDLAWEHDGRRVRHELVQHVVERFVSSHVGQPDPVSAPLH